MPDLDISRCFTPLCRREPICLPVMVVPILNWPLPAYLQLKGPLCYQCAAAFSIDKFTDYMGSWYDMICDHIRSLEKPAVNPFPNDPDFKWEEFRIRPGWEPAPKEQCKLQLWKLQTIHAKGMSQRLF